VAEQVAAAQGDKIVLVQAGRLTQVVAVAVKVELQMLRVLAVPA
jgi:hypothetical protein